MAFYATGLTTAFKSRILDRVTEKLYHWLVNICYQHQITIHRHSVAEFDLIWDWCNENFEKKDWVFTWEGTNIHDMTFCFRQPKQLVYFALRWA